MPFTYPNQNHVRPLIVKRFEFETERRRGRAIAALEDVAEHGSGGIPPRLRISLNVSMNGNGGFVNRCLGADAAPEAKIARHFAA